ncbi:MAG: lytic transglycosylase domain-containing protein [Candidatus Aureabacteria bacterium]|nr:lytic transglycosylase domain-containing protein [Candidatus Auribacterota bacterium]
MSAPAKEEKKRKGKEEKKRKLFWIHVTLFFFVVVLSILVFHKLVSNLFFPEEYRGIVKKYSSQYDLDPLLVSAVIYVESHYDPSVVSNKGAVGLMQVLPSTAETVARREGSQNAAVDDLKNPEFNIKIGCSYLRYLLDRHDNSVPAALAAYNAGGANVNKWVSAGEGENFQKVLEDYGFKETKNYVENVQKIYQNLTKLNRIKSL